MPRVARFKGIHTKYHVIMRGNERKNIFHSDDDKQRFIDTLERMREKYNFIIEAYCLMDNHIHLLIDDNGNDISLVMKSINISYAYYFNKMYDRRGHLFQDRFLSEIINNDSYLLSASAYIHNNPVRANMVKTPEDYKWSSMNIYLGNPSKAIDVKCENILSQFSRSRRKAVNEYLQFVRKFEAVPEVFLDTDEDSLRLVKEKAKQFIETYQEAERVLKTELESRGKQLLELRKDKILRKDLILLLRKNSMLTLEDIGKLCGGFSQSSVSRILQERDGSSHPNG